MNIEFDINSEEIRTSSSFEHESHRGHGTNAFSSISEIQSSSPGGPELTGRRVSGCAGAQEPSTDFTLSNTTQQRGICIDPSLVYDLSLAHRAMQGRSSSPAPRPNFGTYGRTVKLRTNHFPVHSIPDALHEYHVEILPENSLRAIRKRIYHLAEQTAAWEQAGMVGTVVHDAFSRLISSEPLQTPLEIQVHYNEEGAPPSRNARLYTLSITFVKTLDIGKLIGFIQGRPGFWSRSVSSVLSALNLIQRAARGNELRWSHLLNTEITTLGSGLEAHKGFTATLRPARGQLTIRVDLSATSFYVPGNLAAWMIDFQGLGSRRVLRSLSHVMVVSTVHNVRKKIQRVSEQNSDTRIFQTAEFGEVTVRHYCALKYGIQLGFPHLPLVDFTLIGRSSAMLPPELCTILPDQSFRGQLPSEQDTAMSRIARVSPNANATVIRLLGQQPVGPILSSCGMHIGPRMLEVLGRVLPKPEIVYSTKTAHVNDRAQWDLRHAKFVVGAHLDRWAILVINSDHRGFVGVTDPELRMAASAFRTMCNQMGISITGDPSYVAVQLPLPNADVDRIIADIRATLVGVQPKPQAILAVLANRDKFVYQCIKHLCDVVLDVTTICVLRHKFRDPRPQYLSSLSLKFNMKLGGINHKLDEGTMAWLNVVPTMVVGIDILHPMVGDAIGTPSIAAVVASIDDCFAQYPATLSFQSSGQELIPDLKTMMIRRLRHYQNRNDGKLPERVLVYRNSVSETMFDTVLSTEVPRMMDAFQTFELPGGGYNPKLTLVICCKNQRTWFCVDGATGDGNPEPGTVVDRGVISAYNFDFYLQAHGGVTGTARPTLYTVIYNGMGARADEIQGATHALSYMYAPATHAVSLAAPAHYADLACKHARCYLWKFQRRSDMDDEDMVAAMGEVGNMGEVPGWGLSSTMFYI